MFSTFDVNMVNVVENAECFCRNNFVGNAGLSEWIKITEEEKIAMENDYDPIEAPPGPYTIQPDVPGKYCKTEQNCKNKSWI